MIHKKNETSEKMAMDFFEELLCAYRLTPDYDRMYDRLGRIFSKLLFQNTDLNGVRFSGPFAQTNYLLKEQEATYDQMRIVHDARVRLRNRNRLSSEEKRTYYQSDFEALSVFVGLIYAVDIPRSIKALFPTEIKRIKDSKGRLLSEVLRMFVESWDSEFLYGKIDGMEWEMAKVCYAQGNLYYNYDWTYLTAFLYAGMQLNLIRPRIEGEILYPELIIVEPDLLIDVSAIANCFLDYGTTPLTFLLNKIRPSVESSALTMGNLAGQFFDEEVNIRPEDQSFRNSIYHFYQSNPLSMVTSVPDSDLMGFKEEAMLQKRHIHDAVRVQLPCLLGHFNLKEIILEPSFFSEMLGIQARMDFLQLDQHVVIEQKSGKCGFPQQDRDTPIYKEQHYVQLLLYMLILRYNYRNQFERNRRTLQAFLLYSKYKNSLLSLDFAPELVFKAIQMRNSIAWHERMFARDGFRLLDELKPEDFCQEKGQLPFFERYIRPSLEAVLTPIHRASPLEKSYFFRFLQFIEIEHLLSKIGNQTKENSGFASIWHDSLDDKLQAGNIYHNLILMDFPDKAGKIEKVNLHFSETEDHNMSNFRPGDIVILYPYAEDKEPDARYTLVFRCTIAEITTDTITLKLRAPQSNVTVFTYHNYYRWAIEHDFMESSYASLYRGMHAFLSAPQERRDLLLLQRKPLIDRNIRLIGEYKHGDSDFTDLMLRVKQAQDFYLILGPPGTGKTSFGLMDTLKETLLEAHTSVLLLSYTNRAIDEICSKLVEAEIDFIRMGSELSCSEEYRKYLLKAKAQHYPKLSDLKKMLIHTRVYVGTTAAINTNISIFKLKSFDLAIIDEASQILEPHVMGILCAKHGDQCAVKKFVLIGDHKQLPAVVQQNRQESVVTEPELNALFLKDCRDSFFQRMYEVYGDKSRYGDSYSYMLTKQGRMHPEIADFPNAAFYGNLLKAVPNEHQSLSLPVSGQGMHGIDDLITTRRIAFISVSAPVETSSDKVNQTEADLIAAIVYRIYLQRKDRFDPMTTVGVIVPYRNQIATIRNTIDKRYKVAELHGITIDTVERYQGSQRDYILYGFTIHRPYQLDFLSDTNFVDVDGVEIDRKLNVAMTRAREHLFMIGNPALLSRAVVYAKLIAFVRAKHSFFEIEPDKFIKGEFEVSNPPSH